MGLVDLLGNIGTSLFLMWFLPAMVGRFRDNNKAADCGWP